MTAPTPLTEQQTAAVSEVLDLVREAARIAATAELGNLFLPGRLKELALADALGHVPQLDKHGPDAHTPSGGAVEYLTCLAGNDSFSFDHLSLANMHRITRNEVIVCATFDRNATMNPVEVFEVDPAVLAAAARAKITRRRAMSDTGGSTVSFSLKWVRANGRQVLPVPQP